MNYDEIIKIFQEEGLQEDITISYCIDILEKSLRNKGYNFVMHWGATKVVFDFDETDFVVKISLDNLYGTRLYRRDISDYCEIEHIIYEDACKYGVGYFFAETKKIGEVDGHSIWVQPRCESYLSADLIEDISEENRQKSKNFYVDDDIELDWIASLLNYYTEDEVEEFFEFIVYEGVNDLHDENYGYRHGKGIVFDYSGYYE